MVEQKSQVNPILIKEGDQLKEKTDRVTFDEQELADYDKTRGQKMKITDPKTPYEIEEMERAEALIAAEE